MSDRVTKVRPAEPRVSSGLVVSPVLLERVACPNCLGKIDFHSDSGSCNACGATYPFTPDGQVDLRLRAIKRYPIVFEVGSGETPETHASFEPIPLNPAPLIDYLSIPIPPDLMRGNRLTRELLSHFPRGTYGGAILDIGCGGEPFSEICSHTNLDYIGIDYDRAPHYLADAHALPFKDSSFDAAISFAVLEHLRNPFVALREIVRILKPGASFIGTVAFLEPFHLNSYYHPTHLGTHHLLTAAGFQVQHLEPNRDWHGLHAQACMSLFPHLPWWLAKLAMLPLELVHRAWWKLGHMLQNRPATSEQARQLSNTAGFRFVCRKPA